MGLSRMSDEMLFDDGTRYRKPSLKDLYRHRYYIEPEYGDWESWYAWHPVRKLQWAWVPEFDSYLKLEKWVWRTELLRRKVSSRDIGLSKRKVSWEYITMEEALLWT